MNKSITRLLALLMCAVMLSLTACASTAAPAPTEEKTVIRIPEPVEYESCTELGTPLADARVRRALALAIDMNTVVEALYSGTAESAHSFGYDPENAKELLAEAGWPSDYVLDVVYAQEDPQMADLLDVLIHYWEAVGVRAEARRIGENVKEQLWTAPGDPEGDSAVEWDLALFAVADLTQMNYYERFASDFPRNSHTPQIEGLDEAIEAGNGEKAEALLEENVSYIPLLSQKGFVCISDRLNAGELIPGNERFAYQKDILNWTVDRENETLYTGEAPEEAELCPLAAPGLLYHELVFDCLISADSEGKPAEGRIAESYIAAEDGKSVEFTLREELLWHDGKPLTAEDVKFTFELYLQCADLDPVLAGMLEKLEGAEDFVNGDAEDCSGIAVEENTITFRFAEEAEEALTAFSQWPVLPKHKLETVKPAKLMTHRFWKTPIGSGPYKVVELEPGKTCLLERWEDYWQTGEGNISFVRMNSSAEGPVVLAARELLDYGWGLSTDDAVYIDRLEHMELMPVEQGCRVSIFINQFPHESYHVQEETTQPTEPTETELTE